MAMDGPDWPKEDWPLSTTDARLVGEAETMITAAQQVLVKKIEPLGGLPRVHESNDVSILEQLVVMSEMMSGYCELIERHVSAVKKVYRSKKKQKKHKGQKAQTTSGPSQTNHGVLPPLPPIQNPMGMGTPPTSGIREN